MFKKLIKIFNNPVKVEGKPKISTKNENYQRQGGDVQVVTVFSNTISARLFNKFLQISRLKYKKEA